MFKVFKKQIRPSTDINFYSSSDEYKKYLEANYIKTGKLLGSTNALSEDKLVLITESVWLSSSAFREFIHDPICVDQFLSPAKEYSNKHNIIVEASYNENSFVGLHDSWKQYDPAEYFRNLQIPDDWNTLEEFVDWYMKSKMPIMVPWDAEVIRSDDAVAVCIFRKGNYQVEFYLEYPEMFIRKHAHPRMEVITMDIGGGGFWPKNNLGISSAWGTAYKKLLPGEFHGGDSSTLASKGFITLAFQRWENKEEMTSAAVQWNGELQGPIQKELILKKKQKAIVTDNYADVTLDTSVNFS